MTDTAVIESPAAESAPTSPAGDVLSSLTSEQRGAWLKTGELPGAETTAAPATDAPAEGEPAEPSKPTKTASPRHDINARLGQLSEQKRTAEARAEAAERRVAEFEARAAAAPPATTTEAKSEPVAAQPPTGQRVYQTPKGVIDFSSEDPGKIVEQFIALGYDDPYAAMNWFTPKAMLHFQQQDRSAQDQESRVKTEFEKTYAEVRAKYPDWSRDVLDTPDMNFEIPGTTIGLILDSPNRADVIYYFSEHPAEGRKIAAMGPLAAARALGALETTLSAVSSTPATRKTVSSAPAPGPILGSRHQSGAGDDLEDAARTGDTRRYIDLANQRELAERRGARR